MSPELATETVVDPSEPEDHVERHSADAQADADSRRGTYDDPEGSSRNRRTDEVREAEPANDADEIRRSLAYVGHGPESIGRF
jgi:hypothetical protein